MYWPTWYMSGVERQRLLVVLRGDRDDGPLFGRRNAQVAPRAPPIWPGLSQAAQSTSRRWNSPSVTLGEVVDASVKHVLEVFLVLVKPPRRGA